MRRILTFEFVQNNNNARSGFTLLKKRSGMVSNLLKSWRNDFATVERQGDGFGAFRKETGCHPASSRTTSSTAYVISTNSSRCGAVTVSRYTQGKQTGVFIIRIYCYIL
jgi:hypothetical protein